MQRLLGNLEAYRGKLLLRDSEISNSAEVTFCKFLEPITSTRIMYYGNKSYKLFLYEYSRSQILLIVNLKKSIIHIRRKYVTHCLLCKPSH